jgi:hypothetical protein
MDWEEVSMVFRNLGKTDKKRRDIVSLYNLLGFPNLH